MEAGPEKVRRENMKASPIMLLKTHVEKIPENGHAIISMKIKHIESSCHYVDEK
jgi:hypothetical protein